MRQWRLQSTGCSNGVAHPGMPHVTVFPWLGMVSTKHLDVTDGLSNIVRRPLTNSFGWALTPVQPTVVLVSFNHMTMLALVQLGIRNNYSNNLSLRDRQGSSDEPKAGWPGELSHEVIWLAWGSRSGTTRPTESSLSGPWGPSIYTFMGVGPSLVIGCACVSHELLKHVEWHSWSYWQWVLIPSTNMVFHWQCWWLEGNGMGRPHQLEYLWHICRIYTAILNPQLLHNTCRMVLQIETFPGFFFLSDSLNEHHKLQDILQEILLIDYGIFTGFRSRRLPSSTLIMGKLQELQVGDYRKIAGICYRM